MNILFISSGNSKNGISPIIVNQGQSLIDLGYQVSYFTIKGKGLSGYTQNIFTLRRYIKNNRFDIIHAHYSLSAFVAKLGGAKPLVVSLMGSDVKAKGYYKKIIYFLSKYFWKTIIVKSEDMKISLGIENVHIIPNGVNFEKFKPIKKSEALDKTQWNGNKTNILFAANPERQEKNFKLAKDSFDMLDSNTYELKCLVNVPNQDIPYYLNSADVVILTSLWEGSPNVMKEAMACNRPIVATNVGDIQKVIKNTRGCYVTSFDPEEIKNKIEQASKIQITNGRSKIEHLEASIIARKLINIYQAI